MPKTSWAQQQASEPVQALQRSRRQGRAHWKAEGLGVREALWQLLQKAKSQSSPRR